MNLLRTLCTLLLLYTAGVANAQLSAGLVAHWPFNGNLNDVTGNGHNASASMFYPGYLVPGYAAGITGVANTAYTFKDSVMVTAPYQADLNVRRFSICVTVKSRDFSSGPIFFERTHNGPIAPWPGFYRASVTNLGLPSGTKYSLIGLSTFSSWTPVNNVTANDPGLDDNRWYSMVVTFDSLSFKTYINGKLRGSYPWDGTPIGTTTQGINIGHYLNLSPGISVDAILKGWMDDLRLYNRVLADSDIINYALTVKDTGVEFGSPIPDTAVTGFNLNVNYIVSKPFKTGNSFTLQLSDASGSFASPVTIAAVTATTAGAISGNVLSSTTVGWRRMRIVSTSPVDVTLEQDIYIKNPPPPFITVTPSPGPTVSLGSNITFSSVITNGGPTPTYQWKKNSTPIAGATSSSFIANNTNTVSDDTIFAVVHTGAVGHPDSAVSNKVVIHYTGGVGDVNDAKSISLFPNPNDGNFMVKGKVGSDARLEVINISGQVVYAKTIKLSNNEVNSAISLKDIPNGVYTVKLTSGDTQYTKRFTLER
jgi:hypothetical protein